MAASAVFALVMPFLNEAAHLPAVLESIGAQRLDHRRFRLIAVDNGSTDAGPAIVRAWLATAGIAGEIVTAHVRSIPHALNRGMERVRDDEVAVRLDAHTLYGPEYLGAIAAAFARLGPEVWCVGASPVPGPQADFARSLHGALFTNPLGLGPAPFRHTRAEIDVAHVYLGAWRPGVMRRLGGYDERWLANEDSELSERLRAAGGRIVRIALEAHLILTRGPVGATMQWHRYGTWRARTIRRHPAAFKPRHLAPPLALAAGAILLATPWRRALVPLGFAYAALGIAGRAPGESPLVTAASLLFFPAVHVAFGFGLLRGAFTGAIGAPPAAPLAGPPASAEDDVPARGR